MIISVIKPDRLSLFSSLDPFDRLKYAKLPGYTCIGIMDDVKKKTAEPIGVLVYSILKEMLTIEWVYVIEDCRGYGYGELMMKAVFELAHIRGESFMCAYLPDEPIIKKSLTGREGYLLEHFFFEEYEVPGEWSVKISQIRNLKFFTKMKKPLHKEVVMRQFSKLDEKMQKKVSQSFMAKENADLVADISKDKGMVDPDCSVVCGYRGKVYGAVFVMDMGSEVMLSGLMADDDDIAEQLITEACFLAEDKYPGNKKLTISFRNKEYMDLMGEISAGKSAPARMRYADVAEYRKTMI